MYYGREEVCILPSIRGFVVGTAASGAATAKFAAATTRRQQKRSAGKVLQNMRPFIAQPAAAAAAAAVTGCQARRARAFSLS